VELDFNQRPLVREAEDNVIATSSLFQHMNLLAHEEAIASFILPQRYHICLRERRLAIDKNQLDLSKCLLRRRANAVNDVQMRASKSEEGGCYIITTNADRDRG